VSKPKGFVNGVGDGADRTAARRRRGPWPAYLLPPPGEDNFRQILAGSVTSSVPGSGRLPFACSVGVLDRVDRCRDGNTTQDNKAGAWGEKGTRQGKKKAKAGALGTGADGTQPTNRQGPLPSGPAFGTRRRPADGSGQWSDRGHDARWRN
jgi:hypothetical protein